MPVKKGMENQRKGWSPQKWLDNYRKPKQKTYTPKMRPCMLCLAENFETANYPDLTY